MIKWPKPNTLKSLRGFLGLIGYYRRFIRVYGVIAGPLTKLLKNGAFKWDSEVDQAFEQIIEAISTPLVLALPDFNQIFIAECDASGIGLGVVLMQRGKPISYFSKSLKGRELSLSTYKKEFLALVTTVQKWRPYLLGQAFKVKIDQQSFKYLLE
jgi:hypothetical protein